LSIATLLIVRTAQRSTDFEIKGDRTLVTLSSLKLHSVALIKIFDLNARSEAAAMKEYIFTTIVWSDESKSLLPDDFFNRSGHDTIPSFMRWLFENPLNWIGCLTTLGLHPRVIFRNHISKAHLSSILYYITGHGYGHAVRSNQVIRHLQKIAPHLNIHVRTTAPEWLIQGQIIPSPQTLDIGIVQKDSLDMDLEATLQACQALQQNFRGVIQQEMDFVSEHQIRLIVGDIPSLCFEIAARVAIPSVAIGNFTWSEIYRAYIKNYPGFISLIEEMEDFYREATLALTLPYPCGVEVFPRRQPIPWIARTSSLTREQARLSFGLPQSSIIVLLSFGGLGLKRIDRRKLKELSGFFFVTTGEIGQEFDNMRVLPEAQRKYEDLVRAVDVVVTKPGYGIVADVISHRVRVLYTDRGDFSEYPYLVQALNECATAEFIAQDELLSGNIEPYLHRLLNKEQNWPDVGLDGARIAAEKILALMEAPGTY
jgi:Glycosyl transferase family 1